MDVLESWLGALAALTEPYWLTLQALGGMIATAGAGTALVGLFLLFMALDFLRASKGVFVPVSRVVAVAATLFAIASFVYGDFLAGPAKAAYSAIVSRSPVVSSNAVVLTTLSAASAGAFYYAGRKSTPRRAALAMQRPNTRLVSARRDAMGRGSVVAEFGQTLALDPAGRLQLRQLSRNPKKGGVQVRSALRSMPASADLTRSGRRIAHS